MEWILRERADPRAHQADTLRWCGLLSVVYALSVLLSHVIASRFLAKQSPISGQIDRLGIASSQRTLLAKAGTTVWMQD
jgi:hypothetical protein